MPLSGGVRRAAPAGPAPDFAFGAYQRGYFLTALHEAEQRVAADPKDAAAMTLIGEIYSDGYATPRNRRRRRAGSASPPRWAIARRRSRSASCCSMARRASPTDRAAAKALFEKAAAKGQAGALYNLGVMAIEGEPGSPPNFAKAADFFRRSAEAGDGDAAYSYGVLLREGKGVSLDIGESARWLKRAADAGVIAGQVEYAIMLFNGVGVDEGRGGRGEAVPEAPRRTTTRSPKTGSPISMCRPRRAHGPGRSGDMEPLRQSRRHRRSGARRRDLPADAGREASVSAS